MAINFQFYLQVLVCVLDTNQLSGPVPYMPKAVVMNMSDNAFTDARFEVMPTTLQLLYLANNSLTGDISQLGECTDHNLTVLDLSYNNLGGSLPEFKDMPHKLSIFNISNNRFVGTLPSSWSRLDSMAELRLDNNNFTGKLQPEWSAWGKNTDNSLQLSITNTCLHGHIPRQWIEQFCLAIVKNGTARVLVQYVNITELSALVGPLIELPAQRASINVTLESKTYSFDYDNPNSVCGIAHAARNTALLWGVFAALLLAIVMCICLWQRCKPKLGPQGSWIRHWRISTVLRHDRLSVGRQVAHRVWFLISDVGWTIYDQVTDAITIHQVFSSGNSFYAYILLAVLLVPFAVMFVLVVTVSIKRCQEKVGCSTVMCHAAGPLMGLLLAPILFFGLELALVLHGIGIPLPAWYGCLGVDLVTFYRMQSVGEAFLSALPQSIVQSKLYVMGNDPNGIHVYIDTNLYLISMVGSLFSILKTVALIAIELHQYGCSLSGYFFKLIQFQTFSEYRVQM